MDTWDTDICNTDYALKFSADFTDEGGSDYADFKKNIVARKESLNA